MKNKKIIQPNGSVLEKINNAQDLKSLTLKELPLLASDIRKYLIETVNCTGGHLASNLGVVELTLALHYVFSTPEDKIVWDVGHQSYVHKILTGRKEALKRIRCDDGISGFPKTTESEHDCFNTGHSSTSISAALGLARARDLQNDDCYNVVSVIGDGALSGGMAMEALNDLGASKTRMIVVLNDNDMSISHNVGGISKNLNRMRASKKYSRFKLGVRKILRAIPLVGKPMYRLVDSIKERIKYATVKGKVFEQFGVTYIGPIDGHNTKQLINFLRHAKEFSKPVLLHVITKKGKGMLEAESNPVTFHGVSPASSNNLVLESFSEALGKKLSALAKNDLRITAITAAMKEGAGLESFCKAFPDRCFDVAIAEQHAVTMAAGLAINGMKPYVAVYSTFLQRAFDQILHDVALQNLPVTFCLDRAGIVGRDGATHQGVYDLSYLSVIPNMTIFAPKDVLEFEKMLEFSTCFNAPLAIRYPKDSVLPSQSSQSDFDPLKWETLLNGNNETAILAVGDRMIEIALKASKLLNTQKIFPTIINARCVLPLDEDCLNSLSKNKLILTMEDNILEGGFGSRVDKFFTTKTSIMSDKQAKNNIMSDVPRVINIGFPNEIIEFGSINGVFSKFGITAESIAKTIAKTLDINV